MHSRPIILLTALGFAGLIAWAGVSEIDQVSRAAGHVIPSARIQIVQSIDGGSIKVIHVKEGDIVRKGQALVTLDQVKIAASVTEGRSKVFSLEAIKARIEAELFDRPLIFSTEATFFPEFAKNQTHLFNKRRIAHMQDVAALELMLELIEKELAMNQPLLEQGDVSRSEVLRIERSVAEIKGQIASRKNRYLQDLQTEYARVEEELVSARQVLAQREATINATLITAPANGIIKNIRLTTIGAVLRPSDEVLQIVPTGDVLIVEAKVPPADIAYVRSGQTASVKFDAYDPSIYGSADGIVTYVSADTLSEQTATGEEIYYRVHIRVDTRTMQHRGKIKIELQPGMMATTEIITGRNTVLRFLLKPITRTIEQSFGER